MAVGVLFWLSGDIFYLVYNNGLSNAEIIHDISDTLYTVTSYSYTLSVLAALWIEYHDKNIISLIVNAFLFAIAVFVLTTTIFGAFLHKSFNMNILSIGGVLNIFTAMFIVISIFMLAVDKGMEVQSLSSLLIFISFCIYGILDIRYTYLDTAGINAESVIADAIFLFSIVILGFAFTTKESENLIFKKAADGIAKDNSLGIVAAGLLLVFGLLLFVSGVMQQSDFFILLTASLSYLLVMKMIQVNELNSKLIENQNKERAELQERVKIQQKEISTVNAKLENATVKDVLTGLYNRNYWKSYSTEMALTSHKGRIVLYSIDINFFKMINDKYGHTIGDKVLTEIGNRLNSLQMNNATAFRFGGDQFLVTCVDEDKMLDITSFAQKIVDLLDTPFEIGNNIINITVSVGGAIYPENTDNLEKLLNYAESARNTVKHISKESTYTFFDAENMPKIQRKFALEQKLQNADFGKDFVMYYQPQIEAKTGRLIGMEALIRWIDSNLGFVSPAEFIPIAEEMGIMSAMGQWITVESMKQIRDWNTRYKTDYVLGINVSPMQLREDSFADRFINMMRNTSVDPKWLDIEITEGIALNGTMNYAKTVDYLKSLGITFSVDDFGTGYAAFANMINFNFDRIKIAKELVDSIESNNDARVIVGAIIEMTKGMNLHSIAEGVETKEQLDILINLGCEQIQGYYFGRPLPADDFEKKWL